MKTINSIYLAVMLGTAATGATAQELNQEITVEHEIVPVKREALKLAMTPEITLPAIKMTPLSLITRGVGITLSPDAALLGPVQSPALRPDTIHTGYAALGYWPLYNLAVSAGIGGRSKALTGNAWVQFDGHKYKRNDPFHIPDSDPYEIESRRNTLTAGGRASVATGAGSLNASLAYTADWYNSIYNSTQSFDSFDFSLGFNSPASHRDLIWHIGAMFGLAGFGDGEQPFQTYADKWDGWQSSDNVVAYSPVKESTVNVDAGFDYGLSDRSQAGLNISFDYQRDNRRSGMGTSGEKYSPGEIYDLGENHSTGVVTLRPQWSIDSRTFAARIGANLQLSFYSGANSGKLFHIAPDISLAWMPVTQFTVYAKAGGGEHFNTIAGLHAVDYHIGRMMSYGLSHIPITAEGGFTAGPFSGVAVSVYAKYAKANEWLMPADGNHFFVFEPVDISGALLGAEISWSAGRKVQGAVRYEYSPDHSYNKGWYLWRDRARQAVRADLTVRPFKQLSFSGSWEFRDGRYVQQYYQFGLYPLKYESYSYYCTAYGVKADLSLGAAWAFSDDFNVWVRCDNILGRNWYENGLTPVQGFHGLVGFSCQF